ncbi:VOC family protein [Pollutimonas bauzanensis]|uniref:VOC family protein n=1 Tax=Pollutimonas bauzanensis TaxID=658167 RepID=UPI00333E40FC
MEPLAFDHLVLMVRDRLTDLAPRFEQDGYTLTDLSIHNLGSINRLITLDSAYIELLGWPQGKPPARKEIADSPEGLDALVLRSNNAGQTFEYLKSQGFAVNPVQRLERALVLNGATHTARFDTVRFSVQPLAGLRVYFCQHLTPELVWAEPFMQHDNGAKNLTDIVIAARQPQSVAQTLATLAMASIDKDDKDNYVITLPNLRLRVSYDAKVPEAKITEASLVGNNGKEWAFNTRLTEHFPN